MTDEKPPIAWLPAEQFALEAEQRYLDLFSDLLRIKADFKSTFYRWNEKLNNYELSVSAKLTWHSGHTPAAVIELQPSKRYQSMANVKALEERGYKRGHPTSVKWTRTMLGKPSPEMVANHLFAGVKHLVDFKTNMGFDVSAESNQAQRMLDEITGKHRVWGVPVYPDIWFLNT